MERLGEYYIVVPILLGILFFILIEYLLMRNRNSYQIIDPPSTYAQLLHLTEMYESHIKYDKSFTWYMKMARRHKDAKQKIRIPYLNTFLFLVFVLFLVFLIFISIYQQAVSNTDFLIALIALVVLFTGILIIVWHIIIGGIVFHRIIKRIKRQYDLENSEDITIKDLY